LVEPRLNETSQLNRRKCASILKFSSKDPEHGHICS